MLGSLGFDRDVRLRFSKPAHGIKSVDLFNRLIRSQMQYAWKAERVSAFVAIGFLHKIKRYLYNDSRLYNSHFAVSEFLDRMRPEPVRELGNFGVSQTRVCLSDIEEGRVRVACLHCERVIGQDVAPAAISNFHSGHHDVER